MDYTVYIYTDTNPITLSCSLARGGNNGVDKGKDKNEDDEMEV